MKQNKDWSGNGNSVWKMLGASNHTDKERELYDYYATDPIAIDKLVSAINIHGFIWEPACGAGHLSKRLQELGYEVFCTDIVDRGSGDATFRPLDFLHDEHVWLFKSECILTNPPYKYATEFVLRALEILKDGQLCCMFLKTTFLEGKRRREQLFDKYPPKYVLQFSERVMCAKNGEFDKMRAGGGSAVAYAWFVWEKGYTGDTILRWI